MDAARAPARARASGAQVTAKVGDATFFRSPAEFRRWLAANHAKEKDLLVGFHKRSSGVPSLTWPESVDQALCFGWIDGVRKRVDDARYTIRFCPRKTTSNWSAINIAKMRALIAKRLVKPAGRKAFEAREEKRSGIYSYENRPKTLGAQYARELRGNAAAWAFFAAQPPWYRRLMAYWVMSAKQEETQKRRLARLVAASASGKRL